MLSVNGASNVLWRRVASPKSKPLPGEPAGGGHVAAERLEGLALGLIRDVAYTRIEDTIAFASSAIPSARAFTTVAAAVRFNDRAILETAIFSFARPFNL